MHKQLPLNQEQLENFILHHIHVWSQEYVDQNGGKTNDAIPPLAEVMDQEFGSFYIDLADKFRKEVLPKFERAGA